MQGGDTHAHHFGQFLHTKRLGVIRADPGDRFRSPLTLFAERGDGAKARTHGSAEDAVDNLALDEIAEEWDILRLIQEVHQTATGTEELDGGLGRRHATRIRTDLGN